jgi:hypothetical protein
MFDRAAGDDLYRSRSCSGAISGAVTVAGKMPSWRQLQQPADLLPVWPADSPIWRIRCHHLPLPMLSASTAPPGRQPHNRPQLADDPAFLTSPICRASLLTRQGWPTRYAQRRSPVPLAAVVTQASGSAQCSDQDWAKEAITLAITSPGAQNPR